MQNMIKKTTPLLDSMGKRELVKLLEARKAAFVRKGLERSIIDDQLSTMALSIRGIQDEIERRARK